MKIKKSEDHDEVLGNKIKEGMIKLIRDVVNDNTYFFWLYVSSFIIANLLLVNYFPIAMEYLKIFLEKNRLMHESFIEFIPIDKLLKIMSMVALLYFIIVIDEKSIYKEKSLKIIKSIIPIPIVAFFFGVFVYFNFNASEEYLKYLQSNLIIFLSFIVVLFICKYVKNKYAKFIPLFLLFIYFINKGLFENLSQNEIKGFISFSILSSLIIFFCERKGEKIKKLETTINLWLSLDYKKYVCIFALSISILHPFYFTFFIAPYFAKNILKVLEVKKVLTYDIIKSYIDIILNIAIVLLVYKITQGNGFIFMYDNIYKYV